MNIQDIDSLGWSYLKTPEKQTAGGIIEFNHYAGGRIPIFRVNNYKDCI
jgi:hypothetical protein